MLRQGVARRRANYIEDCDVRGPPGLSSWSDPVECCIRLPTGHGSSPGCSAGWLRRRSRSRQLLENIDDWMTTPGVQLAHHKMEAVMLTKKWAYNPPQLSIGGTHIQLSKHLRCLGVILDPRLSFVKHAETVAKKASTSAIALSRLMLNIRGPVSGRGDLRTLASVVEIQLLYAAPVWLESVSSMAKARTILRRPQRVTALRTIRAYSTVSDEDAFVLSGMPPVDLIVEERARIKTRVSERPWTYHMTQALSGHGCFQR